MSRNTGQQRDAETRYWPTHLEARGAGEIRRIGGIGVPYGKRSRLLPGGFYEIVESRALRKTLGDNLSVVCRMEHHPEWLLATTDSGSLRLADEERGLAYEADLPDTTAGRDCYELVRTGRMAHSSMGFVCFDDEFRHDGSALIRHLVSVKLTEISPVSQPAYFDTSTAIRSLAGQVGEDPAEVAALAAAGELRALFSDRHPVVIDVGATAGECRSDGAVRELDLRRKLSEERARRYGTDTGDPAQQLLDLYRRRNRNNAVRHAAPVTEARTQWIPAGT
jgi:HK97 family phage prohead protease